MSSDWTHRRSANVRPFSSGSSTGNSFHSRTSQNSDQIQQRSSFFNNTQSRYNSSRGGNQRYQKGYSSYSPSNHYGSRQGSSSYRREGQPSAKDSGFSSTHWSNGWNTDYRRDSVGTNQPWRGRYANNSYRNANYQRTELDNTSQQRPGSHSYGQSNREFSQADNEEIDKSSGYKPTNHSRPSSYSDSAASRGFNGSDNRTRDNYNNWNGSFYQPGSYFDKRPSTTGTEYRDDFYDGEPEFKKKDNELIDRGVSKDSQRPISKHETAKSESNGSLSASHDSTAVTNARPSLIPKDFKDDYNDDEDEEIEQKLRDFSSGRNDASQSPRDELKDDVSPSKQPNGINTERKLERPLESSNLEISETATYQNNGRLGESFTNNIKQEISNQSPIPAKVVEKVEVVQDAGEESDNYDPEVDHDVIDEDIDDASTALNEEKAETLETHKVLEEKPVLSSTSITQGIEIQPDIFPLTELEYKIWELKKVPRNERVKELPYLLAKPLKLFDDYPFYERNVLVNDQVIKPKLLDNLSILKGSTLAHKIALLKEYSQRNYDWNQRCKQIDDQLRILYPSKEHEDQSTESVIGGDQEPDTSRGQNTRRGRYHGDTVRSEAEFLEILKKLEQEKEDDPIYRAEQLAADIPDMILNPLSKNLLVTNTNNLVLDKAKWAERLKTDGVVTFTKKEHEAFCEAFLSQPKKFGRISNAMGGLRSSRESVLHYYKSKKSLTDYKQLLALKKKRTRKGQKGRRGVRAKSGTGVSTPNTPATDTPVDSGDELSLENFIPKEATTEVLYTESGRYRRAAAPVFDSLDPSKTEDPTHEADIDRSTDKGIEHSDRKRSLETAGVTESATSSDSKKALPAKKKPRGVKPKASPETQIEPNDYRDNKDVVDEIKDGKELKVNSDAKDTKDYKDGSHTTATTAESKNKGAITSYWSVKDINLFTNLLKEFGPKWTFIAQELKTKSPVMVRNYYQRNADRHGWRQIVENGLDKDKDQVTQSIPKNPPLGLFTAPSNVPSNLSASQPSLLNDEPPLINRLPPLSGSLPGSGFISSLPLQVPHSVIPAQGLPTVAPPKPNPFSITSLLNPTSDNSIENPPSFSNNRSSEFAIGGNVNTEEQQKPGPLKGTFSNNMNNFSYAPREDNQQAFLGSHSSSEVTSNTALNSLDALAAAAEDNKWTSNTNVGGPVSGLTSSAYIKTVTKDNDTQRIDLAVPGLQSNSITALPSIKSSNLRNILISEPEVPDNVRRDE